MPILKGMIARRVLLNFRADPEVAARLVPPPLKVVTQNGSAIVGVCLIRLEQLRPRGSPVWMGLSSENMAHRIAVSYPTSEGRRNGVFIWRRETDQRIVACLGGRAFPGVHRRAAFRVAEENDALAMTIRTERSEADVSFRAAFASSWRPTPAFPTFEDANHFLREGSCGFSCGLRSQRLEGMVLRTLRWEMRPLEVGEVRAAFYENPSRFPNSSVAFDCALLMQNIPHEWHELSETKGGALQ